MSSPSDHLALLLPFSYWIGTRLRNGGERVQYVFAVLGPQVFWISMLGEGWNVVLAFALGFAAMICVYELGYISNDHWAQKRERDAGLEVRKKQPDAVSKRVITVGIGLRLLAAALLLSVLNSIWGGARPMLCYLLAVLLVFTLHNVVLGRARVGTFFVLYALRLALPLLIAYIVLPESIPTANWAWAVYGTVFSAGFAITYGMKKNYLKAPLFISKIGGIELPLLFVSCTALGISFCAGLVGAIGLAGWFAALAIWHLGYWVVWATLRFAIELKLGLRRATHVLSHCHTNYSHDGVITLDEYRAWLAQDNTRTIYLTDHAEDFDTFTFERLRNEFTTLGPRVKIGLEYPIAHQHILAHNLNKFVETEGLSVEQAMKSLSENAERLIWAHPRFRIRSLLSGKYLADMLTILVHTDGVEFFNPKNVKRRRYRVMMAITAWIAVALYGRRSLYLGVDAHHPEELPGLGTWRRANKIRPTSQPARIVS